MAMNVYATISVGNIGIYQISKIGHCLMAVGNLAFRYGAKLCT